MHSIQKTIGECPVCGDEIYVFLTKSNKRLAKCVNDHCPKKIVYGLPHAGEIQVSGENCPKSNYPVIIIIPKIKLNKTQFKKDTKKIYFWSNGPCFTCNGRASCAVYLELKDEYCEDEDNTEE